MTEGCFIVCPRTPEIDSVASLKKYALEKEVCLIVKWNLVTGDKKQIYALARKSIGK